MTSFSFSSVCDVFLQNVFHIHPFSLISTSNLVGTKTHEYTQQYNALTASLCFHFSYQADPVRLSFQVLFLSRQFLPQRKNKRPRVTSRSWATASFASHNLLPPGSQLCIAGCLLLQYRYSPCVRFDCPFKESEFACHRTWGTVCFRIKLKLFCCLLK